VRSSLGRRFSLAPLGVLLYWFPEESVQIEDKAMAGKRKEAVGYLRTSSATNVGADKDSAKRQRAAIEGHAKSAGYVIVQWFDDDAVRGDNDIKNRPGFAAMLSRIAGNGVRTIIVETANRFARDLMVQEVGYRMLCDLGITLIAADSPSAFLDDGPTSTLIRQILGAVAQFDKAMTVAKLKGARDRKKRETGKCGGRRNYAERDSQMVALARYLRGGNGWRPYSLRKVSADLAAYGYTTPRGMPYSASAVQSMLDAS
jgi:DNA invertase Pin-like site-specific DNA recombinase